jgi:hypothetical protein
LARRLKASQAVVWYLYHSGVAVKTQRHLLLFDYSNDEPATPGKRSLATGVVEPKELAGQNVLVFIAAGGALAAALKGRGWGGPSGPCGRAGKPASTTAAG